MSPNMIRGLLLAATVVAAPLAVQGTADADPLDAIMTCESGGNPRATNGSHFGLFQFDMSTWRSVGGKGNPMNASPGEQRTRAQKLLQMRGTQPWNASKHCWRGKATAKKVIKAAPYQGKKVVKEAADSTHTVRRGQTFSGIAHSTGHSLSELRRMNPQVANIHALRVGQRLNV